MDDSSGATISLMFSYEELVFLLGLLRLSPLPGFTEDFIDEFQTESGMARLNTAQHALQARDMIRVAPDHTVTIDPLVAALLVNVTTAQVILTVVNVDSDGIVTQIVYSMGAHMLTEYSAAQLGIQRLTWLPDLKTLNGLLLVQAGLDDVLAPKNEESFPVQSGWIKAYQEAAQLSHSAAQSALHALKVQEPIITAIDLAFSKIADVHTVIGLRRINNEIIKANSFTAIRTSTDLWLLASDPNSEPDNLILSQCGSVQVANSLLDLEKLLLPELFVE